MSEELELDYVSPLPPVRSGIADYSADLLPELARRVRLRLIQLPDQPLDPALAERFSVAAAERLGEDGRLPLYQMGNNRHHEAVFDLARRLPGIVTLHDVVLHHFLIGRTVARGDFESYRRALAADHGWIGVAAAMPMRWPGGEGDSAQFALPAHRRLLDRQLGVLVHSAWAASVLAEELPGLRVRSIPMGIPLPPPIDASAGRVFRERLEVPPDAPLLGSFGFQTPMKRTRAVLRALARPELREVYLLIGGEVAPACRLESLAHELGVTERVRFLGFLPFADFESAIAAVDLCLNLRYPTAGETSASLLRILALGKPALVSDYAQSAELDAAGVIRIPVGDDEETELVRVLGQLLHDRERLAELGQEARAHIAARHRPADAADAVVAACRAWHDLEPVELPPPSPAPVTTVISDRLPGTITVDGADSWPPGARRRLSVRLSNQSDVLWLAGERGLGGVALETRLIHDGRDLLAGRPWPGLPVDLPPGGEHVFTLELRRPLGDATLYFIPHVLGRTALPWLGGPSWEQPI